MGYLHGMPMLREGRVEDAAALAEFAARAFEVTFGPDNTPEDMAAYLAKAYGMAQQRAELADPTFRTLLVEEQGAIIGFAQLRRGAPPECVTGPDPVEVHRFYVDRGQQGRGVAQDLMEAVRATAGALGNKTLWLGVFERNPRAIRFYEKCGFSTAGTSVFYVGSDAQTDLIMAAPVRPVLDDSPPRVAVPADIPVLNALIARSARGLSRGYYTEAETEALIRHVFGVDSQLIEDGTYFVIERVGLPVACGGWSARDTLYGGDQTKGSADPRLDPAKDAARIRAFFVHPDWARQGLGRLLLRHCEGVAARAGFRRCALMATLPGEPMYRALGYHPIEEFTHTLPDGLGVRFVRMERELS